MICIPINCTHCGQVVSINSRLNTFYWCGLARLHSENWCSVAEPHSNFNLLFLQNTTTNKYIGLYYNKSNADPTSNPLF